MNVHPATTDRWADLVEVFGPRGDDRGWCWCQLFVRDAAKDPATSPDNRMSLHEQVTDAPVPPGLIAYVDGRPAGWSRVGPRSSLPRVKGNRALASVLEGDDDATWWVACFSVARRHRGAGVASALLVAAVEFARDHGGVAVEGHPVDVANLRAERVAAAALYTGTRALFAAAGFVEVARTYPTRPVMRLSL